MNNLSSSLILDQYELLIQAVVDFAIYMLDPSGRVMSWNAGAERIKGFREEEIIGKHFSVFYTPEDRVAGVPDAALRTAAEMGRFAAEGWRCRRDGSRFWASVVIDPVYREGLLVGFAKVARDMTEQHEARRRALESERQFRLLVEGVTDHAIYMLSPDGTVTSWNAGAKRIKGYEAAEIIGQHFSRFYTDEDVAAGVPEDALATAEREGRYEAEGWRRRRDGSCFWAGVVLEPIRDNGRLIGFAKITRDLTERQAVAQELENSREQVFQLQKMEAVGQLAGGLAHDFNNMLTAIGGSLELLRVRLAQGRTAELDRYITAAEGASRRAAALTHRLLAFSRRQTLDPKPTDINRLVMGIDDLLRRTTGPAVKVEVITAGGLWNTMVDQNQLENALLNLAINSRDAMPDGGTLVIETGNKWLDERGARERSLPPGQYVSLCVSDCGTGMAPDVIARAFDPFFTTKPIGMGTGLGLSMVYGFVRQSGGQVRIYSEPGHGTMMRIYLPRFVGEAEAAPALPSDPSAAPLALERETVLVVDDEPTVRILVIEVLEDLGYAPLEAEDGPSGLKILQSDTRIDLLVTDVGLPGGMNGRQLADAARQARPNLKVLFITGYAENAVLSHGHLSHGMQVLTKPFAIDSLAMRIRLMIDSA